MLRSARSAMLSVRTTVVWGDMDALGHVNNTIYLRWFEEARIQYFRHPKIGWPESTGIILAHQRCDYLAPVHYPDVVETRVWISKLGNRSMTMSFEMRSETQQRAIARGEGVIVAFDYAANTSVLIPDDAKERVREFDQ